jgi:hypothetical protein
LSKDFDVINVNRDDLKELKLLYKKSKPGQIFLFKGKEVLREYAKYMIKYLEGQFK